MNKLRLALVVVAFLLALLAQEPPPAASEHGIEVHPDFFRTTTFDVELSLDCSFYVEDAAGG